MVLLAKRFPRLISIQTSAIFVSGTRGITSILKYISVNPIRTTKPKKHQKDWREEKLQVLGNIRSGHHQIEMIEKVRKEYLHWKLNKYNVIAKFYIA